MNSIRLHRIQYLLQIKRVVFILFVLSASLSFIGCKKTDNSFKNTKNEVLDGIEAIMFQQPESLDSLLGEVDTTTITQHEQARINTIRGLFYFENEEYDKSIKELEKAETFFLSQGDYYHLNINKLVKAFTFEYLNLDNNAASLYVECEIYFNTNHLDKFKFYASLGLFRMSKHLNLDEKVLIKQLKEAAGKFKDPNYDGLLYATMGVFEKNDSLKSIYYEKAKSDFISVHHWSRVYATELNLLFVKIRLDQSEKTQLYYNNFNNTGYFYTPTTRQRMRYSYGQVYLYAKQGKDKQSIEVANQVLKEAVALNVPKVETDCVQMLAYLYKRTGDFKNAHIMLERYSGIREKNLEALQQNRLLALGAQYRYGELEREKLELKIKAQKYLLIIGVICLIFILVISIVWILLKKSKYEHEIMKLKNVEIEDQIKNLISSLAKKDNINENLVRHAEDLSVRYHDSRSITDFMEAIDQKKIKTWMEYEACFLKLRPGWIEKLKQAVPELTATDLKYCMCFYFNLNNFRIAELCETGADGVKSAKKRIRDKFSLNDAKEIYIFLKGIE